MAIFSCYFDITRGYTLELWWFQGLVLSSYLVHPSWFLNHSWTIPHPSLLCLLWIAVKKTPKQVVNICLYCTTLYVTIYQYLSNHLNQQRALADQLLTWVRHHCIPCCHRKSKPFIWGNQDPIENIMIYHLTFLSLPDAVFCFSCFLPGGYGSSSVVKQPQTVAKWEPNFATSSPGNPLAAAAVHRETRGNENDF